MCGRELERLGDAKELEVHHAAPVEPSHPGAGALGRVLEVIWELE
jgi:hypothetical protein